MKKQMYCIEHERMVETGQMACMVTPFDDARVHVQYVPSLFEDGHVEVEVSWCEGPFTTCHPPEDSGLWPIEPEMEEPQPEQI